MLEFAVLGGGFALIATARSATANVPGPGATLRHQPCFDTAPSYAVLEPRQRFDWAASELVCPGPFPCAGPERVGTMLPPCCDRAAL